MFALNGRYPIDTPEMIKQASEYFDNNWTMIWPENRREFAKNVQKQANALGTEAGWLIKHYAAETFAKDIQGKLDKRANLIPECKESMQKLAAFVDKSTPDDFASVLGDLDKKFGLISSYGKDIGDPYFDVLEAPVQKEASNTGWSLDLGGVNYTQKDLNKALNHPSVVSMYGEATTTQLQNPMVFDSLPLDDKEIILEHAK